VSALIIAPLYIITGLPMVLFVLVPAGLVALNAVWRSRQAGR
jgi:hypothetical protein